jgi:hypothetical protein
VSESLKEIPTEVLEQALKQYGAYIRKAVRGDSEAAEMVDEIMGEAGTL